MSTESQPFDWEAAWLARFLVAQEQPPSQLDLSTLVESVAARRDGEWDVEWNVEECSDLVSDPAAPLASVAPDEWDLAKSIPLSHVSECLDYASKVHWHPDVRAIDRGLWDLGKRHRYEYNPPTALDTVKLFTKLVTSLLGLCGTKYSKHDKETISNSLFAQGEQLIGGLQENLKREDSVPRVAFIACRTAISVLAHTASPPLSAEVYESIKYGVMLQLGSGEDRTKGALIACPTEIWSQGPPVEHYRLARMRSSTEIEFHPKQVTRSSLQDWLADRVESDVNLRPASQKRKAHEAPSSERQSKFGGSATSRRRQG